MNGSFTSMKKLLLCVSGHAGLVYLFDLNNTYFFRVAELDLTQIKISERHAVLCPYLERNWSGELHFSLGTKQRY